MKRSRKLTMSMVWCVSALLFGTVAQGQTVSRDGDTARGKVLFIKYCTGCHGADGTGDGYKFIHGPDPANLTSPTTRKKSDADLLTTLHAGKPNMPPWKPRLSERESKDVLAYVRTLAK